MQRPTGRRGVVLLATGLVVLLAVIVGVVGLTRGGDGPTVRTEVLKVPVGPETGGAAVQLDATLYLPATTPAPAVLLAHGFGGTKGSVQGQAERLAQDGYVVLAYSARGFGASGGLIHVDSPDFEVKDGEALLDLLAARPEVQTDGPGDPRVGVAGASYGGGLALLLAAQDPRVDAIVPQITWNDLSQSLFPQDAVDSMADGVFKRSWAGIFFGVAGADPRTLLPGGPPPTTCGRFAPDVCAAYQQSAEQGTPTPEVLRLLKASTPDLSRITAPTLLLQGQADSLFPLDQALANAEGITAPVKQVWFAGGHDGGVPETDRLDMLTRTWFDRYLRQDGSAEDTRFEVTAPITQALDGSVPRVEIRSAPAYRPTATTVTLRGPEQTILNPAGGSPAALTGLPGAGAVTGALSALGSNPLSSLPGQTAAFQTAPLTEAVQVVGASTVRLAVQSDSGEATLFAKLYDVSADGQATLPEQLVAPLHLTGVQQPTTVTVRLPSVVLDVPAGHSLRLALSSTDQAYAVPTQARTYRVSLADGELSVPTQGTTVLGGGGSTRLLVIGLAVLAALLLVAGLAVLRARRRKGAAPDPELAEVPLAIVGLGKRYQGGYRAVTDLSFRVGPGQVLGLLGPNGAGKTTTLRMLMGLILPTEGHLTVFGHRITPGAAVLSRVGAFVEGPGFLPHLSGRRNLELYWQATGRPEADAHLETALEVAGLGDDVQRKVKNYSQGMRQRLAIAQAMLGLPDLLVLDEPTNGLDPPQIREMREVLSRYAAGGRTVIVSSHLLAEVEQTCTHVVVMHHGKLVAEGEVADLVGSATSLVVDTPDPAAAAAVASGVPGAQDVTVTDTGITLKLLGTPRAELVRALVRGGVDVERLAPQRGLEEAFLALVGES